MREVIERLGLDWEDKMTKFYRSQRLTMTNSMTQVRHKITDNAIGKWKMYKDDLRNMKDRLLPMLKDIEMLPFRDTVNWDLDDSWDYCLHLNCSSFTKNLAEEKLADGKPKWLPDTKFDGFGSKIEL